MSKFNKALLLFQCLFIISHIAHANSPLEAEELPAVPLPAVSIIIDDLGYRLKYGTRAVNLPGKLTFSFLPHSPHAKELAAIA